MEPTEPDSLDKRLNDEVIRRAEELVAEGADQEPAVLTAVKEFTDRLDRDTEQTSDRLTAVVQDGLSERREYEADFRQRLANRYEEAFDLYDTVTELIAEASRDFWHRYQEDDERDGLTEVLFGNLAQCLRVAREVGHLLRGGYPLGALVLHRTAYEIAVRSVVLKNHGHDDGHSDLAERYRLHDHIGNAADLREYQKNAQVLNHEPFDEAAVEEAVATRNELLERYGRAFGAQYGWAVGLPGVTAGQFRELEELAELDHRRGYYRWASHYVHGDPSSLRMSVMRRGGVSQGVLSDMTNVKITDPAQLTIFALHITYLNMVMAKNPALADLYIASGLPHILDRMAIAFLTAEKGIKADEEKLQSELQQDR